MRSVAELQCPLGDGVQHRLHITWGAGDDAKDLADRSLLIERALQFARAFIDLAFQPCVGLLELCGHPVEAVRERLELVAGVHLDVLVEVAGADALRAFFEGAYGAHHAAREREGTERRKHEAGEEQQAGTHDRCVELRVHLGHRLLDEHVPVQRLDRRDRCEHRRAVEVGRNERLVIGRAGLESGLHVLELGQIGLAQHQPDVGISDEKPAAVDHVGFALVPDLDPRHHVPDELEIDLGDDDRAVVAARAQGDGHVGLGLLAEVHGAEPGLPALDVAEGRLLRAILTRPEVVHAQTRHGDLLVAGRIDLRNVGDFGRLSQQLEEFDAAQLDVARVELRQRGVGQLLLDAVDVRLDTRCRRESLLVLERGERCLGLLVGEIDADRAGSEQRNRDQRQDEQQILAE